MMRLSPVGPHKISIPVLSELDEMQSIYAQLVFIISRISHALL